MSQTTPQVADNPPMEDEVGAPRVRILLSLVPGADVEAAMSVLRRQVYEPAPDVVLVGDEDVDLPDEVRQAASLDEAIRESGPEIDYLWLLHSDARPRPDALSALVAEIERNEAALAGSKLLKAGTTDELESVGGATDVFGEPYSGLDEGEIDLQQYDVVREVAFVRSASMLVRRDLAQGLKGLDPLLPPVAAGLDFSQRTRLAGGKVVIVPSSEVYHQGRCGDRGTGWREQAGRLRAMLIAYSPLTLLWVVPYDLIVSLVDSFASLILLRWKPLARHFYSWVWNLFHLPSTIRQRRRLRQVRSERDEELFRFHAKGSLRLRAIGEEVSAKVLSLFDDDQALARGARKIWASSGIWGALVAAGVLLVASRSLILTGMPNSGYSFPFEPPTVSLQRWLGGWNDSGLGSGASVHPVVGLSGLLSMVWFGAEGAARTLGTIVLGLSGIIGVGRLAGRLGIRGPGRYLAGIVLLAGPGTSLLIGRGSWAALGAAATLPWAVRAGFAHPDESGRSRMSAYGWALLNGALVAFFSPLLVIVPLLIVLVSRLLGFRKSSLLLAGTVLIGGLVGSAFVLGDPGWIYDPARRLGLAVLVVWPVLIISVAAPLLLERDNRRVLAGTGGLAALAAMAAVAFPRLGPGVEEALLITASLGAAMLVAPALDRFRREPVAIVAMIGGLAMLLVSVGTLGNGRLGLPPGDVNERLSFATTLSDPDGPGRILHASLDSTLLAGEARSGPGFFYRVLDAEGTSIDEVWLPGPLDGDVALDAALAEIATGSNLRPGAALSPFAIDWVVLEGPAFVLDRVLGAQLDLVPTPLDEQARVFENINSGALAGNDDISWVRARTGYSGATSSDRVAIAVNHDPGWQPDAAQVEWYVSVAGHDGEARFSAGDVDFGLAIASVALVLFSVVMLTLGRRRSR